MKKHINYVFLFLSIVFSNYAQTWSGCGQGFTLAPKALFNDTISHKLYASGFGTTVDGKIANSIASWDGTQWDTLGHGALQTYDEFLIRYKNKLFLQKSVGINGDSTRIYTWDFNTKIWDSLPNGLVNGSIKTAVEFNNDLIIVGQFNKIGSVVSHNIVRFDGTNFYPVGFPTFSYYIRTVEIYNNEIYIGGNFLGDTIYGGIAKWDGAQWTNLNNGFRGGGPEITKLKTYRNRLYAGGTFYGTKDAYMPSLAAWDGIRWNNVGGIYNHNYPWGVVYNMFELNNNLYVAGDFDRAGGAMVKNMAFWNDTSWCGMNTTFQSMIWVTTTFQNKIYIAEHLKIDFDTVHYLGYNIYNNYIGDCGLPIGIYEFKNNNTLKIYPNPTSSILNIIDEQNQLLYSIIDITNYLGQSIFSETFSNQIDVSHFSSGVYTINIKTINGELYHAMFVKE